jgi:penicillin amidase
MLLRLLRFVPALAVLLLVFFLNSRPTEAPFWQWVLPKGGVYSQLPALGSFLSPYHGFWQNTASGRLPENWHLPQAGLQDSVHVRFDDRWVPHIFAQNEHDLYYAQGYITARMRLWQMETQVRKAGGRLAEVAGPAAVESDRFFRRMGMRWAAERAVAYMEQDSATKRAMQAYTSGINAYIESLGPSEYPIEYKLLDYAPERWSFIKSAFLLKLMAWDLTVPDLETDLDRAVKTFGKKTVEELFPNRQPFQEPVIPTSKDWEFEPDKRPEAPPDFASGGPAQATDAQDYTLNKRLQQRPSPLNGSNNWAIAGEKSRTGYPILCNDPHLGLQLPSLWFEVQLHTPGMNTYGVSLPGAPGVIIGFNERIAWGVTNVGPDILDWYDIRFRDDQKKQEYWHDGQWKPTTTRRETIRVRGAKNIAERMIFTHHGPVAQPADTSVNIGPEGHAVRWMGHEPSNEFRTFYELNKADNYGDYKSALQHYVCPAQNFAYADIQNNIALWANGQYPLRWPGQGKYLLDGTDPRHDWQGFVPWAHNPHIKNPERGFVSSANQHSTGEDYPYYLNWWSANFARGKRINNELSTMDSATVDSMRQLQLDDKNLMAQKALPTMLKLLDRTPLTQPGLNALDDLRGWDYQYRSAAVAPTIFEAWWEQLYNSIWEDEFGQIHFPREDYTLYMMLNDTSAKWYDDNRTETTEENLRALVNRSYKAAIQQLEEQLGEDQQLWEWSGYKNTQIPHMAGSLKPFNRMNLSPGGCENCINATRHKRGPSWRMIVALHPRKDQFAAYGIYPGGQSGNPGNPHFDDFVSDWEQGKLYRLLFLRSREAPSDAIVGEMTMAPEE